MKLTPEILEAVGKWLRDHPTYTGASVSLDTTLFAQILDERNALAADLKEAAGEYLVPMPEPGSDVAVMLAANNIMRRERDAFKSRLVDLHKEYDDALVREKLLRDEIDRLKK